MCRLRSPYFQEHALPAFLTEGKEEMRTRNRTISRTLVASMITVLASVAGWQAPATAAQRQTDHISVRPVSGPGGTQVRVSGYFQPLKLCVLGVSIGFVDANGRSTGLVCVPGGTFHATLNVPSGAALGDGTFVATAHYGLMFFHCTASVSRDAPFTVTNGPGIFNFKPRHGPVETLVTIKGIRFTGATKVTFNGTPSDFTVVSDSKITATVPAGATTGPIKIVTPIGKAISGP